MRANEIPQRLVDILDKRAGKVHSRQGPVLAALAEILTEYKEVNMTQLTQEWFMEMARLIKARDHGLQMIERWQTKVNESEAAIAALSEGTPAQVEPATEPAPVQE
jgi:hypothetical protein